MSRRAIHLFALQVKDADKTRSTRVAGGRTRTARALLYRAARTGGGNQKKEIACMKGRATSPWHERRERERTSARRFCRLATSARSASSCSRCCAASRAACLSSCLAARAALSPSSAPRPRPNLGKQLLLPLNMAGALHGRGSDAGGSEPFPRYQPLEVTRQTYGASCVTWADMTPREGVRTGMRFDRPCRPDEPPPSPARGRRPTAHPARRARSQGVCGVHGQTAPPRGLPPGA